MNLTFGKSFTKCISIILIALFISACNKQDPQDQIRHLEGYWEIDKVEFSKDSVRTYKFNETVDYLDLDGKVGYRKKVRPQLQGTFEVTDDAEQLEIKIEDDHLYLYYSTPYDAWKEKVLRAEENELQLENEHGIIYHYRRYEPLLKDYYETE